MPVFDFSDTPNEKKTRNVLMRFFIQMNQKQHRRNQF